MHIAKERTRCFLMGIFLLLMAMLIPQIPVQAAEVLPSDSDTPVTDGVFMGLEGSYYVDSENALERINEIRYEACTEGDILDPRDTSRYLTEEDYVPIKWSSDLENIARLRAAEAAVGMGHGRLNGKGFNTIISNSVCSVAENLAWNPLEGDVLYGIEQWYAEKSDWLKVGTDEEDKNAVTGHYTSMINPNYTYIGLGDFCSGNTAYNETLSAEFSSTSKTLDETFGEAKTDIIQTLDVLKARVEYTMIQPEKIYVDEPISIEYQSFVTGHTAYGDYVTYMNPLSDISITFVSKDISVAEVSSEGLLTGKSEGTCDIVLSADGEEKATLTVTPQIHHYFTYGPVSDGKATATCTECGYSTEKNVPTTCAICLKNQTAGNYSGAAQSRYTIGTSFELWNQSMSDADEDLLYFDVNVTDQEVLSCPDQVKVGKTITLMPKKAGIAEVTLTNPSNSNLKREYTIRIGDDGALDLNDAEVTLTPDTYLYNGTQRKPGVTVTYDGVVLTEGTDYTVTYENNVYANSGAKAVITGKGLFASTIEKEFTINPIQLDPANVTIKLSKVSYNYTGEAIEPTVRVLKFGNEMTADKEYTVSYKNNVNAGTATVIVTAVNNFAGTFETTFTINKVKCPTSPATNVPVANTVKTLKQAMDQNALPDGWSYISVENAEQTTLTAGGDPVSVNAVYKDTDNFTDSTTSVAFSRAACEKDDTVFYDAAKGEREATCTEDGQGHYACKICGDILGTVTIPKLGHIYNPAVKENEIAPTCTTTGSYDQVVYCDRCKEELSRENVTVDALGHSWEDAGIIEEATCTEDGSRQMRCSRCEAEDIVTIPATGHAYSAWKKVSDATIFARELQKRQCANCGDVQQQFVGSVLYTKSTINARTLLLKNKQSTTALKVTLAKGDSVVSMVSSNKKVFTVKNTGNGTSKITACAKYNKKVNKAYLTITLASGLKYVVTVKIQASAVAVTSIAVPKKSVSVKAGKTYTISPVTLQPITTAYKASFKTSNKKIVTVSSKGVVKGVKKGTAYVTVSAGKKSVKVKVTVK